MKVQIVDAGGTHSYHWALKSYPNVPADCLEPLLHAQVVLSLKIDPESGYPDWSVSYVFSVPAGKCQDSTYLKLYRTEKAS
jgi:hypothetical protein